MMNTVRAYIYRALHSLSTYACLVMMFMFNFGFVSLYWFVEAFDDNTGSFIPVKYTSTIISDFLDITSTGLYMSVIMVPLTVFLAADNRDGYIKNIACLQSRRYHIVFSRMIFSLIYSLFMFVTGFVILAVSLKCFYNAPFGFDIYSLKVIIMDYLIVYAFVIFVSFIMLAARGTALPLITGLLYSLGIQHIFSNLINYIFGDCFGIRGFDIDCIYLTTYNMDPEYKTLLAGNITAVLYIVISGTLSVILMQKRDIK